MEKITRAMVRGAEKVLVDNGIDPSEAETVLQALGYVLLDQELYSKQTEVIECTEIDPFDYERDHQEFDPFDYERDHQEFAKTPSVQYQVVSTSVSTNDQKPGYMPQIRKFVVGTFDCKQEAARKLEDYANSFLLVQAGQSIRVALATDCLSAEIVMQSAEDGTCVRRHLAVYQIPAAE